MPRQRDSDNNLTKVGWIAPEAAAERMGRSVRRTLAYAQAGKIQTHKEINPRTNRENVVLHAGDVERMAAELRNTGGLRRLRGLKEVDRPQAAALEALSRQAAQPERFPLLLTFAQAARYLGPGIPATFIQHLVESCRIEAIDVHPNAKSHWLRVRKADIERFANCHST